MHDNKGVALLLAIIMVSLLMFLGLYFLTNSLTEELIAKSQGSGVTSYYLAESGMNHMIWKVTHDPLHISKFITDPTWATTTIVTDPFGPGSGLYTVTASNNAPGDCDVISTGEFNIGNGNTSQRVIKTALFRPTGDISTPIGNSAGFASFYIYLQNTDVNFLNGSAHCNKEFKANNVNIEMFVNSDLKAGHQYNEHPAASTTIMGSIYAENWANYPNGVGPATQIPMPSVDFRTDPVNSLRGKADYIYTEDEFDDFLKDAIMNNGGVAQLPDYEIIYVDGSIELKGGVTLLSPINGGMLVAGSTNPSDGKFTVGKAGYWKIGSTNYQYNNGYNDIIFTHHTPRPSGIFSENVMDFDTYTGDLNFQGVLYSPNNVEIHNLDAAFSRIDIFGAAIGQELQIRSNIGFWVNLTHDPTIINDTLEYTPESPTLTINHWEEEY